MVEIPAVTFNDYSVDKYSVCIKFKYTRYEWLGYRSFPHILVNKVK
jgi:hypothetical protein